MLTRLVLVALLITAGAACKHNKKANTTVRDRASFEFACPKDELTLRVGDTQGARKQATMIGAYGCGQKAVYVYAPDIDTWVIDGQITPMPEDFEVGESTTEGKRQKRNEKQAAKAEKRGKMGASDAAPANAAPVEPAPEPAVPEVPPDPS
jgi:hypothetical protein